MSKTCILIILGILNGLTSFACTGFYVTRDGNIFAGNNEDYINPKTKMWVIPAENNKYGKILFGFDDYNPQGGINEKGLFFDGFATQPMPATKSKDKPNYENIYDVILNEILSTCSTVEEVTSFLDKYNLAFLQNSMLFFGDTHGNSIIVEGDTILKKDGDFQVTTNFYQSQTKHVTCNRFNISTKMLNASKHLSVNDCRDILDSAHVEGEVSTLYSQVYDIKNMKIYMYNFHNYNECVTIDIKEELKKGLAHYDLPSLFSQTSEYEKFYDRCMADINKETIQRQLVNPKLNPDFKGTYSLQSIVIPGNTIEATPNHNVTIDIKDDKLIVIQQFSSHPRFELFPESENTFFYKISFGEIQISFPKNNGEEFICEVIIPNGMGYKSIFVKNE